MGEIADGLINGDFDSVTGEWLGEGNGYPRSKYDLDYRADKNSEKFKALGKLLGFEIKFFNRGHQMRAIKGGLKLDFYPSTSKVNWVGTKEFTTIENIELFMFNHFKN